MKEAAKLFAYFAAVVLGGALFAPILFWSAQATATHGFATWLGHFNFESFFHRALLICGLAFLWPLLRSLRFHSLRDLKLDHNRHAGRDVIAGFLLAAIPLLFAVIILTIAKVFLLKTALPWGAIAAVTAAAIIVPLIEESFFRGLVFGIFLRALRPLTATIFVSALFAIIHFLKAPDRTNKAVTWLSGFHSIANSFTQFSDPIMVLAAFTTLFLIGWILADARLRTRSLWLPIGLHSGWIFVSGVVGKMTKRETLILPWLGRNMLIGLIPLALGLITWALMIFWLRHANRANN